MVKITFVGAGSMVFAKNVLGDSMYKESLQKAHIALYDIDKTRLSQAKKVIQLLNKNINKGRAKVTAHLGVSNRKAALKNADFVVNAIQVGGYKPSTVIDFEIPKKYGLRQTIADTLGVGGIFRGLRTIPVMLDFAKDMEKVCPNAWLLNYTNPMCILTGAMLRFTDVKTVGLCHSVQAVIPHLTGTLNIKNKYKNLQYKVAGINHMSWLLELTNDGKDIYPEIKILAAKKLKQWRKAPLAKKSGDMVRLEMLARFGYYITESSEHNAEYTPFWIKKNYPELINEFNIPLDEYPRRCERIINRWQEESKGLLHNRKLKHACSNEFASVIMNSIITGEPSQVAGNVLNNGLITNLPSNCVVEVPCLVDKNGVQGTFVGNLPEQCAALNRTNINTQLLTLEAARTHKKEHIYQAAMLDPHTAAELSIDDIVKMCDELIKAHGKILPKFK
ncbi:MAG: alpha-glucosidase/alpha-galactosidase [Planctomycetota bacterium]|nr:MAG: alpha-glucosidase/alpha-galactosidase [Planctomycetota bacterium]